MKTIVFLWITLLATLSAGIEALPALRATNEQSLISFLLQAPPVAEAACFVRDVNSVGVIVDKICDCDGSTVACDVGPIKVGDIELTFCNKKPNQPVEDLLVMKFACDISDPTCGEGTACDIGPIEYDNKQYYLCTYQTGILPPAEGAGICQPTINRTGLPEGPEKGTSQPTSSSTSTTTSTTMTTTSTTSSTTSSTSASTTSSTTSLTMSSSTPDRSSPSSDQTTTNPPPFIPTWRTWIPPTWVWPPTWRPVNPPRPVPTLPPILPPVRPRWPPMGWGHGSRWQVGRGSGRWWGGRHGSRWHYDDSDDSQSWDDDDDDRLPCRGCRISWHFGAGRGHRAGGLGGTGWPWNARRGRRWSSDSSSSSSRGW